MTSDQIIAVIALSTLAVATVTITAVVVVLNRRSPNRRTMRQAWTEASTVQRCLVALQCVALLGLAWNAFRPDDLPRPYGSLIALALIVTLSVPLAGLGRAWRQQRQDHRGHRDRGDRDE